jgi:hypothetical protein
LLKKILRLAAQLLSPRAKRQMVADLAVFNKTYPATPYIRLAMPVGLIIPMG